jgi:YHS domain-containing protein
MAIDPVCKMKVKKKKSKFKSEYKGNTFYFCAQGCKDAFDREPEKYIGK